MNRRIVAIEGKSLVGNRVSAHRVAVRDGKVMIDPQPGAAAEPGAVWKLAPDEVLIPAFHDHHTHLIGTFRPPQGPSLQEARSRRECLDLTERWLKEHAGSAPVIGEGWDESTWDDPGPPTRSDLDAIAGDRPVTIRRVCGHMAIANSAAWERIRPQGDEADPTSGALTESLALGLSTRWPPPPEAQIEGAMTGQRQAARSGVVAIDEMARPEQWRAYRRLEEKGDLWLRVDHAFPLDSCAALAGEGIAPGGAGHLRAVALKGFLDGSFGARTAAITGRYVDRDTSGMLVWEEPRLIESVRLGAGAGFGIRLHAIGARAIALAIRALEEAGPPPSGGVHRIEHAEDLNPDQIARAARAGIAFSMQPNFTLRWQGPGGMYESALGREHAIRLNPYRDVLEGARLLFGSDTMPFGPVLGLRGALEHPDPSQRLSAEQAVLAYSDGPIVEGGRADLVVLRAPGGDLAGSIREGTAGVVWTAAKGRTVWSDPDIAIPEAFLEASR